MTEQTTAEKRQSRKFLTSIITAAAIFVVNSAGFFVVLLVPRATEAAFRLGIDGRYFLWVFGLCATTALGYGAINVWQKHIFAKMAAIKSAGPDDPA